MTPTELLIQLSRFSDRRPRRLSDYGVRFTCVAALVGCLLMPLALSMHRTEIADRQVCVDNAGEPGVWDCDRGHRVHRWSEIGAGLKLP